MLITVIIPVYNSEKYLRECIDSVLVQTFTDFELLLINDGSTDASGKICDEYALKDARVKVFHKENGGVSSARNLGLSKALGEWIWFVDADDLVADISAVFNNLHQLYDTKIDCIMFGYKIFEQDNFHDNDFSGNFKSSQLLNTVEAMKQMYKPDYYPYQGYVWSKLFRKSVMDISQLSFDENIYFNEDRLFCFNFFDKMQGKCLYFPHAQIYFYRINRAGAMKSLEVSFNPKFISDLKALEIMKSISKKYLDLQLQRYSRVAIVNNALFFYSLLRKFSVKDVGLYEYVHKLLKENFVVSDYFKDSYRVLLKYLKYFILHFQIYERK